MIDLYVMIDLDGIFRSAYFEELNRRLLDRSHDLIVDIHLNNCELSGSTLEELGRKEYS